MMSSSHAIWRGSNARAKVMASLTVQPGPQSQGEPNLTAEDLLHGFDAGDDIFEAPFRHHAAIGMRRSRPRRFVVPRIGDGGHHRRIVKADGLFNQGKALFGILHLCHILGVILWRMASHGEANGSVVDTDAIPD